LVSGLLLLIGWHFLKHYQAPSFILFLKVAEEKKMRNYKIAVLPGDGVGPEILAEGLKVIKAALGQRLSSCTFVEYQIGAAHYRKTGLACPPETIAACRNSDAVYFGCVGLPDVRKEDGSEVQAGYIYRIDLGLYANIRPIKLYAGVESPLKNKRPGEIDYVILRENTEGLYTWGQGSFRVQDQVAVDPMIISRISTERIVHKAFALARNRRGAPGDGRRRVTCVDKANVVPALAFFRKVFEEVGQEYPDVEKESVYADAMTVYMLQNPEHYDIVVTENMFGDILSDLGSATVGGLGLAPSAEVGDTHGLFQPIHGSAPDIADKGVANPIAAILSAAMMFQWLGERHEDPEALSVGDKIHRATEGVLAERKWKTRDLGGRNTTREMGDAIAEKAALS
jgi:3-isopropylmalate dehydrogenase